MAAVVVTTTSAISGKYNLCFSFYPIYEMPFKNENDFLSPLPIFLKKKVLTHCFNVFSGVVLIGKALRPRFAIQVHSLPYLSVNSSLNVGNFQKNLWNSLCD